METLLSVRGGHCSADLRVRDVGGEHHAEFVQRLDADLRLADRECGTRTGIAHPSRDLPRDPGTSLKIEDLLAPTLAALDDPELLSVKRMPGICNRHQLRSVC